jgi:hypothetical protein
MTSTQGYWTGHPCSRSLSKGRWSSDLERGRLAHDDRDSSVQYSDLRGKQKEHSGLE